MTKLMMIMTVMMMIMTMMTILITIVDGGNTCFCRASAFASVSDKLKLQSPTQRAPRFQDDDDDK